MPQLFPVRKMDLNLHGKEASVVAGLIATGAISDSKVAADAGIAQSKIAGLVAKLASIDAAILAEQSRAEGAETGLDGRIDTLEGADTVVGSVAYAVKAEETRAMAAEAALDVQISEEVTRALAAEEVLEGRLDTLEGADTVVGSVAYAAKAEQDRAEAAEAGLDGRLDTLEGADTVVGSVAYAVKAEQDRAEAAEAGLDGRLDTLEGDDTVVGSVANAVKAEQTRATTAETALQGLIDSETQRATAAEGEIADDLAEEIARALAAEADLSSLKYDKAGGEIDGDVEITGTLEVAGTSTFTGDVTASGNLTVQGDLVINGNMTSVNSVDMVVNDRLVHLNEPATAGENDPVPTGLAGISIHRGSDAGVEREHAGMVWDEATQKFVLQFLAEDVAGSTKLNFEAKEINGERLRLIAENEGGTANSDIETSPYTFDMRFNNGDSEGNFEVRAAGVHLDMFDLTNGLYAQFEKEQFHVERTADNYATYSQFDINPDGVQLRDGANNPLMPFNDEHLVVKKYVDDAGDALQANIDLKFDKAGGAIDTDGVVTFDSSANNSTLSLGAESVQLHYEAETHVSHYELTNHFEVSISDSTLGGGVNFMLQQSGLSVETSADNNQTFVSVNFLTDGISMLDETLAPVMPTAPEHLVVRKYVDDAIAALDSSSNGDLAAETAARIAADSVLDGKITNEELRATTAEGVIAGNLATEIAAREAAVNAEMLRAQGEEADIRDDFAAADALLQIAIGNEVLRAEGEEAAIRTEFALADTATLSSAEAYTDQKIADLVDSAPALLDTLGEIATALQAEQSATASILTAISNEFTRATTEEGLLDGRLDTLEAKSFREVFIDNSVGGETELPKAAGPEIPDSAATEFYIDGRKMRRGVHFEVAADGSKVTFSAVDAGVMVELRYFA